jgi:hypothetical protein
VVRLTVPRRAVARFGLAPLDALDSSSGTVLADVLVGDDGLAAGIRFDSADTLYVSTVSN